MKTTSNTPSLSAAPMGNGPERLAAREHRERKGGGAVNFFFALSVFLRSGLVVLLCLANVSPVLAQTPLVQFQWAVQAAGSEGRGIAVDAAGNTYIIGGDNLLAKYDPNGNVIWARQIGGSGPDRRFGIALSSQGKIYLTGSFIDTVSFGGISLTSAGSSDIFIAQYDNDGTALWAKRAGGTTDDTGDAVAVDGAGNCYVTGYFNQGTATFGNVTLASRGGVDVFVAKYDTAGNFLWVRQGGASNHDQGAGIAVDGSENMYVTGSFHLSATFEGVGLSSAGVFDWFVAKYDSSGNLSWAKAGGRGYGDRGFGIAVDGGGNSFVTGYVDGDSNPSGNGDLFVAKYDPAGNQVWLKQYGGSGYDDGRAIAVDSSGNLYIVGDVNLGTTAPNPVSFGGISLSTAGNADVVITKLDPGGNVIWAKTAGGVANDIGYGIAVGSSGDVYVTGSFASNAAFGSITLSGGNGANIFVSKITSGPLFLTHPQSQAVLSGSNAILSVDASGTPPLFYQWFFNQTNLLAGQTNATLTLTNLALPQTGAYSVLVSNAFGSVSSSNAFLTVLTPGPDNDSDGLSNELEIRLGTNPLSHDTDRDGLNDYDELFARGTNPLLPDTDADGMPDNWEAGHGLNPLVNDANDDLDLDGLTNLQEYQMWLTNHVQRPDRADSLGDGRSDYERLFGSQTNRFYYDRNDRLIGADYNRGANGFAIAYLYDGNGNLLRQKNLARDANHNGLPDVWEFLHGLTNNASAYADTDRDGWSDYQEWRAGSNPGTNASAPNLLGSPGTNVASLAWPFTPSNFVVAVGQLDGVGAEEIVIGGDGSPGTHTNFLIVLTQTASTWVTQRVDIGPFGVTSLAIGQPTNRPAPAIYAGLRHPGSTGQVVELMRAGTNWQRNLVANSTNEAAFVLGVRGQDLLANVATTNAVDGAIYAVSFNNSWSVRLFDERASQRGLGTLAVSGQTSGLASPLRLLDAGGITVTEAATPSGLGLAAYFSFDDGTATDQSGNGNNGTITGSLPLIAGQVRQALNFQGKSNYVSVPSTASLPYGSSPRTVATWLYTQTTSWGNSHYLFEYGQEGITRGAFGISLDAYPKLYFFTYNDDLLIPDADVPQEGWFHIAVTYDGNTDAKVFINGKEKGTKVLGGPLNTATTRPLVIGTDGNYNSSWVKVIDEFRIYTRALSAGEIAQLVQTFAILTEPAATRTNNWRGYSGLLRETNGVSIFYTFVDDKNTNGLIDFADGFVTAEYLVSGTNASVVTSNRQSIASSTVAQSYGLASVNLPNNGNEVFFTGEPDGQVFAWTATGSTNPLQRQLFSAHHAGKGWHALAGVKTLEPGEGLVGLLVNPATPNTCDVILWPPQPQLPQSASFPQTAPLTRVLPSPNLGGAFSQVPARIWDAEGNSVTPYLQYTVVGTSNWLDATITSVGSQPYNAALRVEALPGGSTHTLVWNAAHDLGAGVSTNVLVRIRARDVTLLGEWSEAMPYAVTSCTDCDGDGLPDDWEMAAFTNLTQGALGDFDGDGFSNRNEYLAGTNPTDPNSSLKLRIERLPTRIQVMWQGGSNATQVLQQSLTIPLIWQDVWTNPASIEGSFTVETNTFYQLRLGP